MKLFPASSKTVTICHDHFLFISCPWSPQPDCKLLEAVIILGGSSWCWSSSGYSLTHCFQSVDGGRHWRKTTPEWAVSHPKVLATCASTAICLWRVSTSQFLCFRLLMTDAFEISFRPWSKNLRLRVASWRLRRIRGTVWEDWPSACAAALATLWMWNLMIGKNF